MKVFKEITNRQKKSYEFPHKFEINEDSLSDPVEIVNNLNLYFSNIGKQTCLNSISYQNFSINGQRSYYKSFVWFDIHEKELSDIIKSLNSKKANGADNIFVKKPKLLNSHIAPIIS